MKFHEAMKDDVMFLQAIQKAVSCMEEKGRYESETINNPDVVKKLLQLRLAEEKNEVFGCLFLDTRHRVIDWKVMFHGTVDSSSVHARPIVQDCLEKNAGAVVFCP